MFARTISFEMCLHCANDIVNFIEIVNVLPPAWKRRITVTNKNRLNMQTIYWSRYASHIQIMISSCNFHGRGGKKNKFLEMRFFPICAPTLLWNSPLTVAVKKTHWFGWPYLFSSTAIRTQKKWNERKRAGCFCVIRLMSVENWLPHAFSALTFSFVLVGCAYAHTCIELFFFSNRTQFTSKCLLLTHQIIYNEKLL